MNDKFGNLLNPGDTVIYFDTGYSHASHIGIIIEEVPGKGVKLLSEKRNPIHRPAQSLISYTGLVPNG